MGEFVTSFDMAGASLTLFWLDDELETFWNAPADSPAYRKGALTITDTVITDGEQFTPTTEWVEQRASTADEASRAVAHVVLGALTAIRDTIDDNVEALGDIDAVAGDGDHGIGMQRGARAAVEAAAAEVGRGGGAGAVLTAGADAWADRAGGTSGALWGLGLRALGTSIGNRTQPRRTASRRRRRRRATQHPAGRQGRHRRQDPRGRAGAGQRRAVRRGG